MFSIEVKEYYLEEMEMMFLPKLTWNKKIKIIDVILHQNKYDVQTFVVLNRMPKFIYEKKGKWLIGEDSGFYNFYYHEQPTRMFQAFGGREFDIPLKNGETIKASGQWWDGTPEEYRHLFRCGIETIDGLNKCNVFASGRFDKKLLDKWLLKNRPSNNYRKYDKRNNDYMVQTIVSKFGTTKCSLSEII